MVDQIKQMQRSDPVAKEQWYAYCEAFGNNIRDPSKHDITFLESFITQYNSGARLDYKEGQDLAKMVKTGQRRSAAWKSVWEMYTAQRPIDGKPRFDPSMHGVDTLEGFFDFIAQMALAQSGQGAAMGMAMSGVGMTGLGGNTAMQSGSGDPLVQAVKAFQRQGQEQKDAWHTFCDTTLGGNRDPARHDSNTLQQFCAMHGVSVDTSGGGMSGGGMSGGGMGGGMSMGMGLGMGNWDENPAKKQKVEPTNPMVLKIKAFQRLGQEQKDAWHAYCDTTLGGNRDPARHDEVTLQQFCALHGVS
jgi:hypothetical protein